MKINVSRSSVCLGDDIDAPHFKVLNVPDGATTQEIMRLLKSKYLPCNMEGGEATWSVVSKKPVAIIAQQLEEPLMMGQNGQADYREDLLENSGRLVFHVNYHGQTDPNVVDEVLRELGGPDIARDSHEA